MNQKRVNNYPDYEVDIYGNVWSFKYARETELHGRVNKKGYRRVGLHDGHGNAKDFYVHRLVLETFVGPCPVGKEARHLNGDSLDNRLENLTWGTSQENQQDMLAQGRTTKGERNPGSKLKEEDVRLMREMYKRGSKQSFLATFFNVSKSTINAIVRGNKWVHVR